MKKPNKFRCLRCQGRRKVYTSLISHDSGDPDIGFFREENCEQCDIFGRVTEEVFVKQIPQAHIGYNNLEIMELYEEAN